MPQQNPSNVPTSLAGDVELLNELQNQLVARLANYKPGCKGHAADGWVDYYLFGAAKPCTDMTSSRMAVRTILRDLLRSRSETIPHSVRNRLGM